MQIPNELKNLLAQAIMSEEKKPMHTAEEVINLLNNTPGLNRSNQFVSGQLVQKKKGVLSPYKFPLPGHPGMYVGEPKVANIDTKGMFLHECAIVKIVDNDGDVVEMLFDPAFLEPYNPDDHKEKQAGADY